MAAEVDSEFKRVSVRDALFVPDLRTNLLSVGKIADKGYSVTFDKRFGKVINKNGQVILVADRIDGLYYLREVNSECNATVESMKVRSLLESWHRRMGHLNVRDLADGVRNGNIRGISLGTPNSGRDKFECEICVRGKMTRSPFPKASERKSELLEIVHSDVCGPMRVESNGKARYVVTFIDDYSKWCEISLLKGKNEVLSAFKDYKAFIEK